MDETTDLASRRVELEAVLNEVTTSYPQCSRGNEIFLTAREGTNGSYNLESQEPDLVNQEDDYWVIARIDVGGQTTIMYTNNPNDEFLSRLMASYNKRNVRVEIRVVEAAMKYRDPFG